MKLARFRKEGKVVFYALDDDHIRQLVYIAIVHAREGDEMANTNQSVYELQGLSCANCADKFEKKTSKKSSLSSVHKLTLQLLKLRSMVMSQSNN